MLPILRLQTSVISTHPALLCLLVYIINYSEEIQLLGWKGVKAALGMLAASSGELKAKEAKTTVHCLL